MRTNVTRRSGALAFIAVDRSRDNADRLFLSSPPICELTREQTLELVSMLTTFHDEMWGKDSDTP